MHRYSIRSWSAAKLGRLRGCGIIILSLLYPPSMVTFFPIAAGFIVVGTFRIFDRSNDPIRHISSSRTTRMFAAHIFAVHRFLPYRCPLCQHTTRTKYALYPGINACFPPSVVIYTDRHGEYIPNQSYPRCSEERIVATLEVIAREPVFSGGGCTVLHHDHIRFHTPPRPYRAVPLYNRRTGWTTGHGA